MIKEVIPSKKAYFMEEEIRSCSISPRGRPIVGA